MMSFFFVLSTRGDTILSKIYRKQSGIDAHERSHTEAFFRKIKFWDGVSRHNLGSMIDEKTNNANDVSNNNNKEIECSSHSDRKEDPPPVFLMPDGQSYVHVKRNGLIFGCATTRNVSPCTIIELLSRIAKVFKDYCGTLSEEAIRKNFILLYELLDEMVDYGYPQLTRTEDLKAFVYNEPIVVSPIFDTNKIVNSKTASANSVHKPVIGSVTTTGKVINKKSKNEIFVDILEDLNVIFSKDGNVLNSTIDGCIQMKSYLAGNPALRLALNENLVIGKTNDKVQYDAVVLDDCSFHDCVNLSEFHNARTFSFLPPDGEFKVLKYRVTGGYKTPFRIFPLMQETGPTMIDISLLIRAEMDVNYFGANVLIELPLPRCTVSAACNLSIMNAINPHVEYLATEKKVLWKMKKFPGGSEQTLKIKVILGKSCTSHIQREIGPLNMNFEIPMFNVSNLQVRYLRVAEDIPGYTPYRWVRYVTQSNSYVCRVL